MGIEIFKMRNNTGSTERSYPARGMGIEMCASEVVWCTDLSYPARGMGIEIRYRHDL